MNSKLVQTFFQKRAYYDEVDSFGHFVLDTEVMKQIRLSRRIDPQKAFKDLEDIVSAFQRHHILLFLTHGTCLGAIREKGFIAYDSDIDLGCFKSDLDAVIEAVKELRDKYGFSITKLSLQDESVAMVRSDVVIDLSLYREDGAFYQANSGKVFRIPKHFFQEIKTITFLGLEVGVPRKAEEYLAFQYGKDWREPIENFHSIYRQKIELPLQRVLKYFVGESYAKKIAKKTAQIVKHVREGDG